MRFSVPHPIPYQGSKRRLALPILSHMQSGQQKRLVEPFAGSAAVTLAAARSHLFPSFYLSDRLEPLARLWTQIISSPHQIADGYEQLWKRERELPIDSYYEIRTEFNADQDPAKLLYLLARCVKNAVRFNPKGEFNQSPDKRRKGTHPDTMRREILSAHRLLINRTEVCCAHFMDIFETARESDFFYLDPPYQGTSEGRDSRYISGVTREALLTGLAILNDKNIPFVLSYDGALGEKTYGDRLPAEIASQILLNVGRSSQATLNGDAHITVESLYVSHNLVSSSIDGMKASLSDYSLQIPIPLF